MNKLTRHDLVSLEVILKEMKLIYRQFGKHDKLISIDNILHKLDSLLHEKELSNYIFNKDSILILNSCLIDFINYFTSKGLINISEEALRLNELINNYE